MDDALDAWRTVDEHLAATVVHEDDVLARARSRAREAGLPPHEIAPNQGALLLLLVLISGARRVLEIGTQAGYSTIWLGRGVGAGGVVTTLEVDAVAVAVARENIADAGLDDRVDLRVGAAGDSLDALVAAGTTAYDLVFLDADKPNNPRYLEAALRLSHSGTVIVADNVIRGGTVVDPDSDDRSVVGVRRTLQMLGEHPGLDATALQTVGVKGWDGFAIARVR